MAPSSQRLGKPSSLSSSEEVENLEKAVERLMHENSGHRETIKELETLLRFRGGSEVVGLKPVDALKHFLTERETLMARIEDYKQAIRTVRSLVFDGRLKETLEWIRVFVRKQE